MGGVDNSALLGITKVISDDRACKALDKIYEELNFQRLHENLYRFYS